MLTIRRCGSEAANPWTSVLPLLPRLHIVLQGRKAAGVAVHSGHGAVLVVLLALSPPGDPLLVVGLQHKGQMGATAGVGVGVGPGHIPNARARASGDQCHHIEKQCLCPSNLENVLFFLFFFFLPLVSIILSFSEAQPGYVH